MNIIGHRFEQGQVIGTNNTIKVFEATDPKDPNDRRFVVGIDELFYIECPLEDISWFEQGIPEDVSKIDTIVCLTEKPLVFGVKQAHSILYEFESLNVQAKEEILSEYLHLKEMYDNRTDSSVSPF